MKTKNATSYSTLLIISEVHIETTRKHFAHRNTHTRMAII